MRRVLEDPDVLPFLAPGLDLACIDDLAGIAAGMLLGIARATGEFGATLMIAGSIPGRTRTLSLALYESIQMGDNLTAFGIVVLLTSIIVLVIVALRVLESDLVGWKS